MCVSAKAQNNSCLTDTIDNQRHVQSNGGPCPIPPYHPHALLLTDDLLQLLQLQRLGRRYGRLVARGAHLGHQLLQAGSTSKQHSRAMRDGKSRANRTDIWRCIHGVYRGAIRSVSPLIAP